MAYEQLLSEGYIESVPCRGYFVCQMEELYHLETLNAVEEVQDTNEAEAYLYD